MSFNVYFLLVFLISGKEASSIANEEFLIQCILEESDKPCLPFTDSNVQQNISFLSPQLMKDFSILDYSLKDAIKMQKYKFLDDNSFESAPPGILLSLPTQHLNDVEGRYLGSLLLQQKNKAVFKHLIKAFLNDRQIETLSNMLQSYDFTHDQLEWAAEVVSFSDLPEVKKVLDRIPLIFYSPPEAILPVTRPNRFFYISHWYDPNDKNSIPCKDPTRRFWAYTMIKSNFPESLWNWNNLYLDRWGLLLTGAISDELDNLNNESINNISKLMQFNFSSVQVRSLFDKFYLNRPLVKGDLRSLSNAATLLLPSQLTAFPHMDRNYLESLLVPKPKSRPTSQQILELIRADSYRQTMSFKYPITKFVYILPPHVFREFLNQPLNKTSIFKIQSPQLTKLQMFYVSNTQEIFDLNSPNIYKCNDYIRVLPTSYILFNHGASHIFLHIISNVDARNVPQTFATLNKFWSEIGSPFVFGKILENKEPKVILGYIPTRLLMESDEEIVNCISPEDYVKIPETFFASVAKRMKDTKVNFKYSTVNESLSFLYYTASCDDIFHIDPYEFIVFLSGYNYHLKASGKMPSKNTQQCSINKLLEVLQLKSLLVQNYQHRSKLSLLNEAEIDAIGGYILSSLPAASINESRHTRSIIKTIGKLSVTELLSAVPLLQLHKLSNILIQDISPTEKISISLFDLGNLTLFLENEYIEQINEDYFKLLLESNYIDHRLCTKKSSRNAFYNLIKEIFGEPETWSHQTLATLGDFLLVVPEQDLYQVKEASWIYAADVLETKYFDIEMGGSKNFYEMCINQLEKEEKYAYLSDLKVLVKMLVRAAQFQLDTVISAEHLVGRLGPLNNTNPGFVDSNKSVKIYFATTKILIDKNAQETTIKMNVQDNLSTTEDGYSTEGGYSRTTPGPSTENVVSVTGKVESTISTELTSTDDLTTVEMRTTHTTEAATTQTLEMYTKPQKMLKYAKLIQSVWGLYKKTPEDLTTSSPAADEPSTEQATTTEPETSSLANETPHFHHMDSMESPSVIRSQRKQKYFAHNELGFALSGEKNEQSEKNIVNHFKNESVTSGRPNDAEVQSVTSERPNDAEVQTTVNIIPTTYKDINNALSDKNELGFALSGEKNEQSEKNIVNHFKNESVTSGRPNDAEVQSVTSERPNDAEVQTTVNIIPTTYKDINNALSDKNELGFALSGEKNEQSQKNIMNHFKNESVTSERPNDADVQTTVNIIPTTYKDINNALSDKNVVSNNLEKINENIKSTDLKLIMRPNRIKTRVITKRSLEKVSCEALKIVGEAVEMIINEELIQALDDTELNDCIDLFSELDLPLSIQSLIWKRIKVEHLALAGKLVAGIDMDDIGDINFRIDQPWALENIYILGKYNQNPNVRRYVANEVWKSAVRPYSLELVVALGSLLCDLPDVNVDIISPTVLLKSSVVLGQSLPCNFTCLSKLSTIASEKTAFGDPINWSFGDIHDLGIMVSGLNFSTWKILVNSNHECLNGLTAAAFECLPYKYISKMRKIPLEVLPQDISNPYMEYDTHRKLMNYDFKTPSSEDSSASASTYSSFLSVFTVLICINVYIVFI